MKKVFLLVVASIFSLVCFAKDDVLKINVEQLPEKAALFIKDYFPESKIKTIYKSWDEGVAEYKVIFKTKSKIEFDVVGAWSEIEINTKKDKMPRFIYTNEVNETLDREFYDQIIEKVENDGVYFEFDFKDADVINRINRESEFKTEAEVF